MNDPRAAKPGGFRRQPVKVSHGEMVRVEPPPAARTLPPVLRPAIGDLDLPAWAQANRAYVEELLDKHAALLFRGFEVKSAEVFERFVEASSGEALEYRERSSPRSAVAGRVYTSTDYPADQSIPMHNESSYRHTFPTRIYFHCVTPASAGGETPVADSRGVLRRIPEEVRARFAEKKVLYVRNYGDGFGLHWREVFQTDDKGEVEASCREGGIEFEWKSGDRLRTRQVRPAIITHPRTSESSWFNHAAFFHVTSLPPALRDALLAELGEENLPTNTYYGDGSPIGPEELAAVRAAYAAETVRFDWQRGDVLMVDNLLASHGRGSYEGERKVLVGMSCPWRW